jgi:hypothetical protein
MPVTITTGVDEKGKVQRSTVTMNPFSSQIRLCPVCELNGSKVHVTRRSENDFGICADCGWRWRPRQARRKWGKQCASAS